jgi:toxin ParE1/3/4
VKLIFTAEAAADLERIGSWIAQDNPARAITFVQELRQTCAALVPFPSAYPIVEDAPHIRHRVHGAYRIYYTTGDDEVIVLSIRHGARQSPNLSGTTLAPRH